MDACASRPRPERLVIRRLPHLIATLALAYALALQGLLGALGAGARTAEARHAAQLGVICTFHGVATPGAEPGEIPPSPGKLACIEHCLLGGTKLARATADLLPLPLVWPRAVDASHREFSLAPPTARTPGEPPPARGPPIASA